MKQWIALVMLAGCAQAQAAQFGGGLAIGAGRGDGQIDEGFELDVDQQLFEFGFLMNMDLGADSSLLMYRFGASILLQNVETNDGGDQVSDKQALNLTNTLAFKFIAKPRFKLWAGPSLYLGAGDVTYASDDNESIYYAGLGPTVGIDYGIGQRGPTLALELAYRFIRQDFADDEIGFDTAELNDVAVRFGLLFGD
ncbi:MAG: hypothetical protein ABF271_04110 [Abyssibacter sp.]|uniref:hypothetical protein n=1 Tax=Abyssibacter sp. TaxID=2320200 RepID=UPI00321BC421